MNGNEPGRPPGEGTARSNKVSGTSIAKRTPTLTVRVRRDGCVSRADLDRVRAARQRLAPVVFVTSTGERLDGARVVLRRVQFPSRARAAFVWLLPCPGDPFPMLPWSVPSDVSGAPPMSRSTADLDEVA